MRIIAAIIAILIVWVMVPHIKQGEFLAPNPIAPNTWMATYVDSDYHRAMATPPDGYGFRRYDVWNDPSLEGRPATKDDFQLRF
jgi:hypothetical protein